MYGVVGALLGALWRPALLGVAAGLAITLVGANAPLYRFFWRKRGAWFTLKAIPWHWFYFLYCGVAALVGLGLYFLRGGAVFRRQRNEALPSALRACHASPTIAKEKHSCHQKTDPVAKSDPENTRR